MAFKREYPQSEENEEEVGKRLCLDASQPGLDDNPYARVNAELRQLHHGTINPATNSLQRVYSGSVPSAFSSTSMPHQQLSMHPQTALGAGPHQLAPLPSFNQTGLLPQTAGLVTLTRPSAYQAHSTAPFNIQKGGSSSSTTTCPQAQSESASTSTTALTNYAIRELIQCGHHDRGRCLQCIDRKIHQIPFEVHCVFDSIFYNAERMAQNQCSQAEAQSYGLPPRSLVNGEIHFPAFATLLGDLQLPDQFCFLDCGSGRGKAVVATALLFPKARVCGLEIRPQLHNVAQNLTLPCQEVKDRIHFHLTDFFRVPWSDADVIMINATGMEASLIKRVEEKITKEVGNKVIFIVISQPLRVSGFSPYLQPRYYRMGWGNATVYTYRGQAIPELEVSK